MPIVEDVRYRIAHSSDAGAIAALHAESWRTAYRGMLPDAYLDNDVFEDRATVWSARFAAAIEQPVTVTVLAEQDGALAGFAHSIVDDDATWGTLLDNLHVRPDSKRLGIGRRLLAETAAWLEGSANTNGLHLWVFEANAPARQFYDALGGQVVGESISGTAGSSKPTLRYYWSRLDALSRLLPRHHEPLA